MANPRMWKKTGKNSRCLFLKGFLSLFMAIAFSPLSSFGQGDDAFTASVSEKEVAVGRRFKVTFQLEGEGKNFRAPDFRFFDVLAGPSRSTQVQIINGNYSRKESYSYTLRPKKKGNFEIGPAKIKYKGKSLGTDPITVKVLEKSAKEKKEEEKLIDKVKEDLFIKCYVDKTKPYKGEQVTATFKLFVARNAQNYSIEQMPQFNGFWAEPIIEPKRLNVRQEVVDGKRYKTAILRKMALFPQKSGELTIDPVEMDFQVRVKTGNRKRGNDIKSFFRRQMGGYETKKIRVKSRPVQLDVKPLPTPRPENFSGLVGQFDLKSQLNKNQILAGNPVNIKLTLEGSGNLKMAQPLELDLPPDFEVYDPEEQMNLTKKGGMIGGRKTFEYLIIPRQKGQYRIDPVEISYFNPELESYESLSSDKFTLHVNRGAKGGDSTQSPHQATRESVEVMSEDIRYIKTTADNLRKKKAVFAFSPEFWTLTTSPFLLLAALAFYRIRSREVGEQVPDAASKKARKKAQKHLKASGRHLNKGDQEGFFEALSDAAWGYASDKLEIPLAELTKDHIQQALNGKIDQETTQRFLQLLDTCEQARFAPSSGNFNMKSLYEEARHLITQIEDQLKEITR